MRARRTSPACQIRSPTSSSTAARSRRRSTSSGCSLIIMTPQSQQTHCPFGGAAVGAVSGCPRERSSAVPSWRLLLRTLDRRPSPARFAAVSLNSMRQPKQAPLTSARFFRSVDRTAVPPARAKAHQRVGEGWRHVQDADGKVIKAELKQAAFGVGVIASRDEQGQQSSPLGGNGCRPAGTATIVSAGFRQPRRLATRIGVEQGLHVDRRRLINRVTAVSAAWRSSRDVSWSPRRSFGSVCR